MSRFADFDKIQLNDCVVLRKTFEAADVDAFADLSGDFNPLHVDDEFASRTPLRRRVAHGVLLATCVSRLIGMELPGPGALWTQQTFEFLSPVFIGDEIEFELVVKHKSPSTRTLVLEVLATNQNDSVVLKGQGTVMVLEEQNDQTQNLVSSTPQRFLENQLVLVSGASRGIGAAIALGLGQAGASVVVNYHTHEDAADSVSGKIRQAGGMALPIQADISNEEAVRDMVRQAEQHFGVPVHILINNASGRIDPKPFVDLEWEDIEQQYDVQIRGAFYCSKAVVPEMIEAGSGQIINIGSASTWGAPPAEWTGYVVAKAALSALTRSLAVELGPKGIRVNSVAPGMTETDLIADLSPRMRKVIAMQSPMRRLATPEDIAGVVLFLCSPAGSYINGAELPVSGGSAM